MSHKSFAAILIGMVIVLASLFTLSGLWLTVARTLVALLVLVVPGYAIASALFPKRRFGRLEILVFSLGLSMAVAALGGLVLNWTPWGLGAGSWTLFLSVITLGAGAIALARRGGAPALPTMPAIAFRSMAHPTQSAGLFMVSAALLLALALRVAVTGVVQQPYQGFTQLWLLPVHKGNLGAVRLGVVNRESAMTSYRLRLMAGGRAVREWSIHALKPNGTWQATVTLSSKLQPAQRVEATLYRANSPRLVYRRVWIQANQQ